MALTAEQQAALDRMLNYYDGDFPYNPATNPGGFRQGGQVVNFEPALKDTANVVKGAGSLIADALAAATDSPKAVRVDSQQSFSSAEVVQALKNIGLLGNSYTLTAAQMDQIRLFIGGVAPGQPSGTGTVNLAGTDLRRPLFATGTPTIVMPNVGIGWHTGPIKNSNTGPTAGTVMLTVPTGATLDGVQNGVSVLYSLQKAAIIQTGAQAYITDWIEVEPVLQRQAYNDNAGASWDLAFPPGYTQFDLEMIRVLPTENGGQLGLRLSQDAGANIKGGSSDYYFMSVLGYAGSVSSGSDYSSSALLTGGLTNNVSYQRASVRTKIDLGSDAERHNIEARSVWTTTDGYNSWLVRQTSTIGGVFTKRPNFGRLSWFNGGTTGKVAFNLRGRVL